MEEAFGIVLFGVVGVVVVLGIAWVLFGEKDTYGQIGRGGLFEDDRPPAPTAAPVTAAVRDDEIRQMLEARNARRVRRGEPPLDVEAELKALTRGATVDKQLLAEVRDLVEARNARRVRRGQPPLDVEAEVQRQLEDLGG